MDADVVLRVAVLRLGAGRRCAAVVVDGGAGIIEMGCGTKELS